MDTAWMLAAPVGVLRIAEFFDQIIYGNEFDGRYKDGIKMKHDVADLLEYPTVKSVLQELEAAVRSELKVCRACHCGGDGASCSGYCTGCCGL